MVDLLSTQPPSLVVNSVLRKPYIFTQVLGVGTDIVGHLDTEVLI